MTNRELQILLEKRVARGVKWLEKRYPDWYNTINLREFDFKNPCKCVIGFVCGEQRDDAFHILHKKHTIAKPYLFGFDWFYIEGIETSEQIRILQAAWVLAITEARSFNQART